MPNVHSQDVFEFAANMSGKYLETVKRSRPFAVRVEGKAIIYTPESGIDRKHDRATLDKICAHYNATGSTSSGDYLDTGTRNASYTIALIKAFESAQAP